MLLVLGDVAGDRLVAELGELDPQLRRRDPVHPVAHDRPRAAGEHMTLRGERDRRPAREHVFHRGRQLAERREQRAAVLPVGGGVRAELGGQPQSEQVPGGELRVERLRRRDTHLDVSAVRRVEHAVALVHQIALTPVHDRDDDGAPRAARGRPCGSCRSSSPTARSRPRACRACRPRARTRRARSRSAPRPSPGAHRSRRAARARGSGPRRARSPARWRGRGGPSGRGAGAGSRATTSPPGGGRRAGRHGPRCAPRSVLRNEDGDSAISLSR